MAMPPVSDDDDAGKLTPLARAMRGQKRPHTTVTFPGLGVKVAIINPSDEELAEAQAAATQYLKTTLRLDEFQIAISLERNLFAAEEQRQILQRVLRDPSDPALGSFGTIEELREHLTPDVRRILMRHLAEWTEARSPERRFNGDTEQVVEFVRDLKDEGALSEYLTSCDFGTLVCIARSLAEVLPKRTKPSSSDTSSSNSQSAGSSETSATTDG